MLKQIIYLLSCFIFLLGCQQRKSHVSKNKNPSWKLVWSDEFDEEGLPDSTKWSYDVGDGCPHLCGWGNNELQYYTQNREKNARVEGGKLIIEAHKESIDNRNFSSARLISKNKGDWKYGKVEVSAKLPSGVGTWAAIWMLPTEWKYGGWPRSGEIDIMEHVGYNPDSIFMTVHTGAYNHMLGTHKHGRVYANDAEQTFHTYVVKWYEDKIDFYMDEKLVFSFDNEGKTSAEWPFDQDFYLILNLAIGGSWGGAKGVDESIFPQRMEVDYVRVYQQQVANTKIGKAK